MNAAVAAPAVSAPTLEPAAQAFADATSKPPFLFDLPPAEGRKAVDDVQSGPISKPDVDIEDVVIEGGPTGQVPVRIMRPKGVTGTLPVIFYIHGAGWVFGGTLTHDRLIRELATGVGAAVVFPVYDLSPEAKYPTALEQSYAALEWVAAHGAEHGLDASRIAISGDSVGGNLSIATTILAKQRGGPKIVAQALFYPVTNADFDSGSYRQFATGYFLQRAGMQWFWDQYTTDPDQRAQITASPLRASLDQLAGLPPALVITAEADVLRDEGEAYAAKLRAAGVPVTATRYGGVIHDFMMLNPLRETPPAGRAIKEAQDYLSEALGLGA